METKRERIERVALRREACSKCNEVRPVCCTVDGDDYDETPPKALCVDCCPCMPGMPREQAGVDVVTHKPFRSLAEILSDVQAHYDANPDHGIGCACTDAWIAEIRRQMPSWRYQPGEGRYGSRIQRGAHVGAPRFRLRAAMSGVQSGGILLALAEVRAERDAHAVEIERLRAELAFTRGERDTGTIVASREITRLVRERNEARDLARAARPYVVCWWGRDTDEYDEYKRIKDAIKVLP